MRVLVEELRARRQAPGEQSAHARRGRAMVDAVHAQSHRELAMWAASAQESSVLIDELQARLVTSQHETHSVREHNARLREQNDLLRQHCEKLRQMVVPELAVTNVAAVGGPSSSR